MTKMMSFAAVLGLLVTSSSSVLAKGPGGAPGGGGASGTSPGQQFRTNGPVTTGPTAGPEHPVTRLAEFSSETVVPPLEVRVHRSTAQGS